MSKLQISIVIPVYSGADYLSDLVDEISELRDSFNRENSKLELGELIFVDDCSIDSSAEILDAIAAKHQWIIALHLSRNFGQHAATIAGILHTSGDWVITMDEDLQHRPKDIALMFDQVSKTNCDVVYGHSRTPVHSDIRRDWTSRLYKKAIAWATGNEHMPIVSSFRLIRGPIARGTSGVCTHDTYFDVALSWFTNRVEVAQVEMVDNRYVKTGKSGYRFRSLLTHARRMLVSSQLKILRMGAMFGAAMVAFSIFIGVGLVVQKIFAPNSITLDGWVSIMLTQVFFGGLCVLLISIVLEYMSTLLLRAHGKPLFFAIDRSSDRLIAQHFRDPED